MLKGIVASMVATAQSVADDFQIHISDSDDEFIRNLEERGLDIEELVEKGCSCGGISSSDDIVAVDRVDDEIEVYCRKCFK